MQDSERPEDGSAARPEVVAFYGGRRVVSGSLADVAVTLASWTPAESGSALLVFHGSTGAQLDLDLRGSEEEIRDRYSLQSHNKATIAPEAEQPAGGTDSSRKGPGRPKLGVVAREITLLPRHWEWLNRQSGGASVTIRKLVEQARSATAPAELVRSAREATYRFASATVGNEPGFEEASRALFAGDRERFMEQSAEWPADLRAHIQMFAESTWPVE